MTRGARRCSGRSSLSATPGTTSSSTTRRPAGVSAYCGLCAYVPHEAYIQTIAVAPDAQHRGLGTALLVAMLDEADRRGCAHVDLEVRADNEAAHRLYLRHGFTDIAVRRGYYQPSGADAIVMRRERAA